MGALRAVYDTEIYENFLEIVTKKSTNDKALILKSLKTHFTFSSLIEDKEIKDILLDKFKLCKVNEGQYLMKQNTMASSFFILHEGTLAVEINGSVKRCIEPGEGFGELALLYSAPRSASIKALKPSFLWFIDRETFRSAVSSMITKNYKENRSFIDKNEFFSTFPSTQNT
jgi:cGMP-dependent protein kinase 1